MSCAANATAAARLPTPGGPCSRYACAGPSASAARRRRFASACSGKVSKLSTDLFRELGRGLGAVEARDPPREQPREVAVRAVDAEAEVGTFALDAIRLAR